MRFFRSKLIEFFRGNGEEAYFITSEKFDSNSFRYYSVRKVTRNPCDNFYGYKYEIETVSELQKFKTSAAAKKYIENLIKAPGILNEFNSQDCKIENELNTEKCSWCDEKFERTEINKEGHCYRCQKAIDSRA